MLDALDMAESLDVLEWGRVTTPSGVEWHTSPHMEAINRELMDVLSGDTLNLIIEAPPRHTKTVMVCQKFVGLYLMTYPNRQVGLASYGAELATDSCKIVRDTVREHGPRQFGYGVNPNDASEGDWSLVDRAGRPLLGRMRSYGVGGPMLGRGNHLLLIDDPIKATDALSPTMLQNCIDWWNGTAKDRVNPGGRGPQKIVMMQRLSENDLVGYLLKTQPGRWKVLTLRAEAEADDVLGRQPGEYLWPKKYGGYDDSFYEDQKSDRFWWESKYQQRPSPRGGGMIQLDWVEQNAVDRAPDDVEARIRWWDRAATEGGGDYTAGPRLARRGKHIYIDDCSFGKWGSGRRDAIIRSTCELDNARFPNAVVTWGEQEPGSSGKDMALSFEQMLSPYPAKTERSSGSKEVRAEGLAAAFSRGEVHVVKYDAAGAKHWWYDELVNQLTKFPAKGTPDDIVDGCSGAYNKLILGLPALGWSSTPRTDRYGRAG